MSSPLSDAAEAHLAALRARLYAPNSSDADRDAYESFLKSGSKAAPTATGDDRDSVGTRTAEATPPARTESAIRRLVLLAAAVALVAGAALGVAFAELTAQHPNPAVTQTPNVIASAVATTGSLPTPLAATPSSESLKQQDVNASDLVKALATRGSEARSVAIARVSADSGGRSDSDWAAAVGCSQYTGRFDVSTDGRPSGFETAAGETSARPTGTHFRLKIQLTRSSAWSWLAYGTTTGARREVVAVGAGAQASGSAQYVEFTRPTTTAITAIQVTGSGRTPFIWQIESCTPDR